MTALEGENHASLLQKAGWRKQKAENLVVLCLLPSAF
jgi:hypothetical protein